jgi:hypothetical protein
VAGDTEGLSVKEGFPLVEDFLCSGKRIGPRPSFLDLIRRDARLEHFIVGRPGRLPEAEQSQRQQNHDRMPTMGGLTQAVHTLFLLSSAEEMGPAYLGPIPIIFG